MYNLISNVSNLLELVVCKFTLLHGYRHAAMVVLLAQNTNASKHIKPLVCLHDYEHSYDIQSSPRSSQGSSHKSYSSTIFTCQTITIVMVVRHDDRKHDRTYVKCINIEQ